MLNADLISQANASWIAYFNSKVGKKLAPTELPASDSSVDVESAWNAFLSKEQSDEKWWTEAKAADEKFTMHITSLVSASYSDDARRDEKCP